MTVLAFLRAYGRPLAVFLLLLAVWFHGHSAGAGNMEARWQAILSKQQLQAARASIKASEDAREQERKWAAAYDLAAQIEQQETVRVRTQKDRIIADLRAGRLSFKPSRCDLPQAPAHPGEPETAEAGGQSGVVGEAITGRLAVCDEVTHERNQLLRLMEAERQ